MELTKEDYIIICGDFGLCWAKDKTFEYHCKNFAEKPYTILWVQGNHENYDMIGEYPLEELHGGKAGGPRSCRHRENCRRACAIWNDITTR